MLLIAVEKNYVYPHHAITKSHAPYVSVAAAHSNYDILWSL